MKAASDPARGGPWVDSSLTDGHGHGAGRGRGLLHLLAAPERGPRPHGAGPPRRELVSRHGPPHGLGAGGGFLGDAALGQLDGDAGVHRHGLRRRPLAAAGESVLALEPLVAARRVEVVEPAANEERAGDGRGHPGQRGEVESHPLLAVVGVVVEVLLPRRPYQRRRRGDVLLPGRSRGGEVQLGARWADVEARRRRERGGGRAQRRARRVAADRLGDRADGGAHHRARLVADGRGDRADGRAHRGRLLDGSCGGESRGTSIRSETKKKS
jgi:hypothetical protein